VNKTPLFAALAAALTLPALAGAASLERVSAAERTVAALGTLQLAYQDGPWWQDRAEAQLDTLDELEDAIAELRADWRVRRFAPRALARAAEFVEELADEPPGTLEDADLERAERLIERARDMAMLRFAEHRRLRRGSEPVVVAEPPVRAVEREVVVVEDERARRAAARAREEAALARAEAEAERARARQAQIEAERTRGEYEELREELGELETRQTERGLVVTLGDVLFEVGRADLKPNAVATLNQLAKAMRDNPNTHVIVEGHTDSTGTRSFNYTLSERRANAVRSFLLKSGVAARRIESRGMGPDAPVASNATASGRAQNRRVEVIVQNED
jgi:outer membrane protein OmpA-like peptidoglycan-associated protein